MIKLSAILKELPHNQFIGDDSVGISGPVRLDAPPKTRSEIFWSKDEFLKDLAVLSGGTVLCSKAILNYPLNPNLNYIIVEIPRAAFQHLLATFFNDTSEPVSISPSAVIHPSVTLGKDVTIGHHVVIEQGCVIGDGTKIAHNTVIYKQTVIGKSVKIGANSTIGGVGFGYQRDEMGTPQLMPHLGNVVIEDHVEIGNNTAIDRAVLGSTRIRAHVKIDNLVHIGHGVDVGEGALLIANCMIGGSTNIGANSWIAPSASLINKISIGERATIGLGAVVINSVEPSAVVVGNPAKPLQRKHQ